MRYLAAGAPGLGLMLVFGLLAVWVFLDNRPVDGVASLIFAVGGSMFFWAALLAAFLDWREGRGKDVPCGCSGR